MDPSKYFKRGSVSYVQTTQALEVIDAAERAGMKDEAVRLRSDLEASIIRAKESGWKNFSGFDMQREVISKSLPAKINAMAESQAKTQTDRFKREEDAYRENKILEVAANEFFKLGGSIDDDTVTAITEASANKDPIALSAYRNLMEQKLSAQRIAQASQLAPAEMAKRQEFDAANATKQRTIAIIDKFIDSKGKPNDLLQRSTGFGEGVGRFFGQMTSGTIGNGSDELVAQDELIRGVVTDDVLKTVQLLKPASNTDVEAIKQTRPSITTSPEQWAAYLQSMKNVLSKEVDPSKFGVQQSQLAAPAPAGAPAPAQGQPAAPTQDQKAIDAANALRAMFPTRPPVEQ
jgi:hypothetical protein